MEHLDNISSHELIPGFFGKFVHGKQSTLAFWEIKKDCIMPVHQHPHEQITHILSGELEMTIGGETMLFTAGTVHVIPSNTPHGAIAKTDCKVIDAFSPARDEYRF
jgi:quercetin dioxygenase-like cupin family protein